MSDSVKYYFEENFGKEKTEEKAKLFENQEQRIKFIEQSMQEYREDKKEMKFINNGNNIR